VTHLAAVLAVAGLLQSSAGECAVASSCQIAVTETDGVVRATYNSERLCGPWPPMWFSQTATVHVLPKGKGFRAQVIGNHGNQGTHFVQARIPGKAQGGTWVTLGPQKAEPDSAR